MLSGYSPPNILSMLMSSVAYELAAFTSSALYERVMKTNMILSPPAQNIKATRCIVARWFGGLAETKDYSIKKKTLW